MADILQIRRDTSGAWISANPILANGEQGYETNTHNMKIGDGATTWALLNYVNGSSADYTIDGGDASSNYTGTNILDCGGA